jgi:hypothetical protein
MPSPLTRQQVVSLSRCCCVSPVELINGRGRGGGEDSKVCLSQVIRRRESFVLYNQLTTLWPQSCLLSVFVSAACLLLFPYCYVHFCLPACLSFLSLCCMSACLSLFCLPVFLICMLHVCLLVSFLSARLFLPAC